MIPSSSPLKFFIKEEVLSVLEEPPPFIVVVDLFPLALAVFICF